MRSNTRRSVAVATTVSLLMASSLAVADFYVAGSVGLNYQDDSNNKGSFNSNFTTGAVTGVTPPLNIPAGSDVGWRTDFDNGTIYSLAFGFSFEQFRVELEYSRTAADINRHRGVSAAGIDLSAIDAGVLISGNDGDLGVTVADLVANGRGDIRSNRVLANAFYDFNTGSNLTPFVGFGLGQSNVKVRYRPSDVGVINDDSNVFTYQLMAGLSYQMTPELSVVGTARFSDSDDARVNSSLLPARFSVRNRGYLFDIGVRYSF